MTSTDSRTGLVWDLLVCSQLTEAGRQAGWRCECVVVVVVVEEEGGGLLSLAILLTFTLQSQLFKAACTSAPCQPASPSCEKWVMEFKGAHSLVVLHSRFASLLAAFHPTCNTQQRCVCVCNSVSCSEIHEAVWEFVWVNHKTFITTLCVCVSVRLLETKLAYILPHDFPLEIKI